MRSPIWESAKPPTRQPRRLSRLKIVIDIVPGWVVAAPDLMKGHSAQNDPATPAAPLKGTASSC